MKKNCINLTFLILLLSVLAVPAAANQKQIEIVSSTDEQIHFVVSFDETGLDSYLNSDSQTVYTIPVQLALPADAQPTIISLIPKQFENMSKDQTESLAANNGLAEFTNYSTVRGIRLVTLNLYPVIDGSFYRQFEIKIAYNSPTNNFGYLGATDIFRKMFSNMVVNLDRIKTVKGNRTPLSLNSNSATVFGDGQWYRIEVNQTGICKITGAQLAAAGISLSGLDGDSIHIYYGGGLPLDVLNENPRPEFEPIALYVDEGGNNLFDNNNDFILFYAEALNRWTYTIAAGAKYYNNIYDDNNVYWLKIDYSEAPKKMATVDGSINAVGGAADTVISSHHQYLRIEQDNMLLRFNDGKVTDYYKWYWSNQEQLTFYFNAPGYVAGSEADIYLAGSTNSIPGGVSYMNLKINDVDGDNKYCNHLWCEYTSVDLRAGSNRVDLELAPTSSSAPYFDYMEIDFSSLNVPQNNQLELPIGQLNRNAEIVVVNNFGGAVWIFDVSDPKNVQRIENATVDGGTLSFYAELTTAVYNRYWIATENAFISPLSIELEEVNDLYSQSLNHDLIIVTPRALMPAMDEYIDYRSSEYSIGIYAVEDIMENFGFGLYDPTAIRDFLKYAYENYDNPRPSAALMVGDGNYDFRNRLDLNVPNYIPPYIHEFDNTSSDDNYVYFGDYGILDGDSSYIAVNADRGFDMIIARWPVRTAGEIARITNKIKDYESSNNFGSWHNNITFVADDEFGAFDNETFHTTQTEDLANNHTPAFINRDKIYMWEYPFVNNEKPAVNDKIVESINRGSILVNYVGHGNPDVWAHEHVFTRNDDLPRLNNRDRLPLFFVASCAIGFFDDPEREGMAEDLLAMDGGAIGTISATRLVYSSPNAAFNKQVFDILLYEDSLSICEAVYKAKLERQYLTSTPLPNKNDRSYLLLGDPYVKLAIPRYDTRFTSAVDSLIALSPTNVTGEIIDEDSTMLTQDGLLTVDVMDSQREKTYRIVNSSGQVLQTVNYSVNGPTIFRGTASISGGQFDFSFIPPLDIGFGGEGARISVYADLNDIDAAGVLEPISISDSISAVADSTGPSIEVSFAEISDFASGATVRRGDHLVLNMNDNSGINLTGSLGHGISLEIDNQPEKMINLTPLFGYELDDFTRGSLVYALDDIEPGRHSFKIKAWDNANNSSVTSFEAIVAEGGAIAINNLLNYPNPMNEYTNFSYELTQPVEKFSLDIYTLSGRKIKSFTRYSLGAGYYDDIRWYGKDFAGDRVATEVYIYKATAYPSGGGDKAESFGKIILIN